MSHAASRPLVSAVAAEPAALLRKPGRSADGVAVTCTGQAISRVVSRAPRGRPADYENCGLMHYERYLDGYHGVVPPMG